MTNQKLINSIESSILDNQSLSDTRLILPDYKNQGGTQKTAENLFTDLAKKYDGNEKGNEAIQDRIYEVLDCVTGWCSPEFNI